MARAVVADHLEAATTASAAAQLSKAERARLEEGITAPAVTAEASVVALDVRSQCGQHGTPVLPAGSRVCIGEATVRALSAQVAAVDASVRGPGPGRWRFVLEI